LFPEGEELSQAIEVYQQMKERAECEICHKWDWLQRHHVFNGAFKKASEKYGYLIDVCPECHRRIHGDAVYRKIIKARFQKKYEEEIGTREDFRKEFVTSYL
jgi:hypothetical protein